MNDAKIPASPRLLLQTESARRPLTVTLDERVTVGRADEGEAVKPGLDLTPYGAAEQGVSRLHAALFYQDGLVYVEDLGSTNGTRINGFQLVPNRPYRLRQGDELEFGSARLTVQAVP